MTILGIAGLRVECRTRYPEYLQTAAAGYVGAASESVCDTVAIDSEPWIDTITNETEQGPESVDFFALSVALGEQLPSHRRLQTHGVAVEYEGKSYIFSAPSGTGKSTRAFLWQKYLGTDKVTVINGDKPILWFRGDDVLACGSPWSGKEGLEKNVCVPLGGICLLRRSSDNTIRKAGAQEYFDLYASQVQLPKDARSMMEALSLIEELYSKVPVYVLENDMSEQGTRVCFETLTGKNFDNCRI